MADFLARRAKEVKKIVLCYEESLPANWLVGVSKLRGKLERAGVEVGGSRLVFRLRQGKGPLEEAGVRLGVDFINASINRLPQDADIILAPMELAQKAQEAVPDAWVISLREFFVNPSYDDIVAKLVGSKPRS